MRLAAVASEICEIPRNSLKIQTYEVQGHPRSSILVPIESPYASLIVTTPCPKKTCDYIFYNNFNNKCPSTIIFVLWINNVKQYLFTHKFFQSKYLSDWLITSAQNVEVSHSVKDIIRRAGTIDRHISCETDIHWLTVHRIIYCDLQLNCVKRRRTQQLSETSRVARLTRCKQLL